MLIKIIKSVFNFYMLCVQPLLGLFLVGYSIWSFSAKNSREPSPNAGGEQSLNYLNKARLLEEMSAEPLIVRFRTVGLQTPTVISY